MITAHDLSRVVWWLVTRIDQWAAVAPATPSLGRHDIPAAIHISTIDRLDVLKA